MRAFSIGLTPMSTATMQDSIRSAVAMIDKCDWVGEVSFTHSYNMFRIVWSPVSKKSIVSSVDEDGKAWYWYLSNGVWGKRPIGGKERGYND